MLPQLRFTISLPLALLICVPLWAGEVVISNPGPDAFSFEARLSGAEAWDAPLTLAAGQQRAFETKRHLVTRFAVGGETIVRVLKPARRYQVGRDAQGQLDLLNAEAAAPRFKPRQIAVLSLADATYRREFPDWQDRIAEIVAAASVEYEATFALRLKLIECRAWNYEAQVRGSSPDVVSQLARVAPGAADLVVGWLGVAQRVAGYPDYVGLGSTLVFGQHLYLVDTDRRMLPETTLVLQRGVAMIFGGFYVVDATSLMQWATNAVPIEYDFGDTNRQVIELTRDFDFRRGVESLSPETRGRIQDLYRRQHHPNDLPANDPIARGQRSKGFYRSLEQR